RDAGLAGKLDSDVWSYAQAHGETILSRDKDFSDIRVYPAPHGGIVIVDVPDAIAIATLERIVVDGLASLLGQSLASAIVTIAPGRVRVRR
ncbi:MAG TPA: DUF5615 family PIN-like protein, partial [Ktedonobacterales bacterium]|nr:DUF5615 family PIN-like protein [Ktedonobacterales bacterium]